jgi:LacI family transcriptional regulator
MSGEFEMGLAEQKAQELVKAGVSAIFIGSDSMAYGALRGLRKLGLHVPNDMALVAMDDLEMSSWVEPALTTVRTDIRQIGEMAAQYVIGRIQSTGSAKLSQKAVPTPQLIVRSSCGAKK